MLPYSHQIYYRDFIPEHLIPTKEEDEAIKNNGLGLIQGKAKKWANKISQIFIDRRYLVGHLFYTEDLKYWHFFYFDQRDLSNDENHWAKGSHIHFINYLWPQYTASSVWEHFTNGNPIMKGSVHIQYVNEDI